MPRVDFRAVKEARVRAPLPPGKYGCRVLDVDERTTSNGDPMWRLRLEVLVGEHRGRFVFDNLVFSARALDRLRCFCQSIGLDTSGELDLTPQMIQGKVCRVEVRVEPGNDGQASVRNKVPFRGYEPLADSEVEEALPF
jgi:hypothetical protein